MFRALTTAQRVVDVLIAAAFFAFFASAEVLLGILGIGYYLSGSVLGGVVVVALLGAALGLRRLSPGLALATAWLAAIVQMALLHYPGPVDFAIFAVLHGTAAYGTRVVRWLGFASAPAGALLGAAYMVFLRIGPDGVLSTSVVVFVFFAVVIGAPLLLSWVTGLLVRTRRRAVEAKQDALRAELATIAEQERTRIARDMHDVVAHSLAVVIAQADGARYARSAEPAAVDAALSAISSTAREALADVRILLAQLRHRQGDVPQPTLADLARLLEQFRASGLEVLLTERGGPPGSAGVPVPSTSTQLAIYRIVQESLTNALRHGDRDHAVAVGLSWHERELELELEVVNALAVDHDRTAASIGHGIAGLVERASLSGGSLTASAIDHSWVVRARLPLDVVAAEPRDASGVAR